MNSFLEDPEESWCSIIKEKRININIHYSQKWEGLTFEKPKKQVFIIRRL
jgi:hypothetical protein